MMENNDSNKNEKELTPEQAEAWIITLGLGNQLFWFPDYSLKYLVVKEAWQE